MTVELAVSLLLSLVQHAQQISGIISVAKAQGRTNLTADEWNAILASDNTARTALVAALSGAIAATPPLVSVAGGIGSGGSAGAPAPGM